MTDAQPQYRTPQAARQGVTDRPTDCVNWRMKVRGSSPTFSGSTPTTSSSNGCTGSTISG
jgi:hypothetical protein